MQPHKKKLTLDSYSIVLCALFAALTAAGAFIKIPGPLVVFTLQTLFATLTVFLLGKRLGTISIAVYVLTGLLGFPVFTQGGGPQYVLQPTFGYLLGFIIGGWVCGFIIENLFRNKNSFLIFAAAGIADIIIVYTIGTAYYCFITTFYLGTQITDLAAVITGCALVFIPEDLLSMALAAVIAKRLRPFVAKTRCRNNAVRKADSKDIK